MIIFSWELSDGAHVPQQLILRRSEGCLRGRYMQLEDEVNNCLKVNACCSDPHRVKPVQKFDEPWCHVRHRDH